MVEKIQADGGAEQPLEPAKPGTPPKGPGSTPPTDKPLGGREGGGQLVGGGGGKPNGGKPGDPGEVPTGDPGGGGTAPDDDEGEDDKGEPKGDKNDCGVTITLTRVALKTNYRGRAKSRWNYKVNVNDQSIPGDGVVLDPGVADTPNWPVRVDFKGACGSKVKVNFDITAAPGKAASGVFSGVEHTEMEFDVEPRHAPCTATREYECGQSPVRDTMNLKIRFRPKPAAERKAAEPIYAELEFHLQVVVQCRG